MRSLRANSHKHKLVTGIHYNGLARECPVFEGRRFQNYLCRQHSQLEHQCKKTTNSNPMHPESAPPVPPARWKHFLHSTLVTLVTLSMYILHYKVPHCLSGVTPATLTQLLVLMCFVDWRIDQPWLYLSEETRATTAQAQWQQPKTKLSPNQNPSLPPACSPGETCCPSWGG